MCGRRTRKPWPNLPIEPRLLLMRIVHRHERPEPVRADVAGDDQEIASWNVWQEPVLIAERHDSHVSVSTQSVASSATKLPDCDHLPGVAMRRRASIMLTAACVRR